MSRKYGLVDSFSGMDEEELIFQLQLEKALAESRKEQSNSKAFDQAVDRTNMSAQEIAFFTDENLVLGDNQTASNKFKETKSDGHSFHVRTGLSQGAASPAPPIPRNSTPLRSSPLLPRKGTPQRQSPSSIPRPAELSPSPYVRGNASNGGKKSVIEGLCHTCRKPLNGPHIEAMNLRYHADCFKCKKCHCAITSNSFVPYGNPKEPFHLKCAQQDMIDKQPKLPCYHCHQIISSGPVLKALDRTYHPNCFNCYRCKKRIEGDSYIPYGSPSQPLHPLCAQQEMDKEMLKEKNLDSKLCYKCRKPFSLFGDSVVSSASLKDRSYHSSCFRCEGCLKGFEQQTFVVKGEPPQPYHERCARELFNPRCCVCSEAISGRYYSHPFFQDEVYCQEISHERQRTCCSCGRREPFTTSHSKSVAGAKEGFNELQDGRALCGICVRSIIMDSSEAAELYAQIVDFMETYLQLRIPPGMREVPVLAVDFKTLNENAKSASISTHNRLPSEPSTSVRGLTISSRSEIRHMTPGSMLLDPFTRQVVRVQQPSLARVEETRTVSAVLVLFGLTRDLTASVLAHEAMHVWMKLSEGMPFDLQPQVEEGICQVVSYKFLEALSEQDIEKKGLAKSAANQALDNANSDEKLRAFYRHQIQNDPTTVYGEGFRLAKKCEGLLGFNIILEHIAQAKAFPKV